MYCVPSMPVEEPANNPLNPVQNIILDTNIFNYSSNKFISTALNGFLSLLTNNGFVLAFSDISICELLSGATISQEKAQLAVLNNVRRYLLDDNVLIGAARLQSFYKKENVPEGQIDLADRIIAATTIITGSLILTANVNDFPRPFFREVHEERLLYRKKDSSCMQVVQLLSPNIELIN